MSAASYGAIISHIRLPHAPNEQQLPHRAILNPRFHISPDLQSPVEIEDRRHRMVAALTEHEKEIYLTTIFQRPVSEFFADSQKPDQGRGQVVALVSSLDHTKQLLDEFVMCGDERAIHQWRSENSPTEYACGECGLGLDSIGSSTLVFSEESCRIPWSRWRASAQNLPDDQLFAAMTDADAAFITHGQEGFTHSTRPKYVVSAELRVLRHELKRRGLDWFAWDKRMELLVW